MVFGAGLGVGLMVFATAEPLGLKAYSPEILDGAVMPNTAEAVESAYRLHTARILLTCQ
jgi:choline-glycine betaine transporter